MRRDFTEYCHLRTMVVPRYFICYITRPPATQRHSSMPRDVRVSWLRQTGARRLQQPEDASFPARPQRDERRHVSTVTSLCWDRLGRTRESDEGR